MADATKSRKPRAARTHANKPGRSVGKVTAVATGRAAAKPAGKSRGAFDIGALSTEALAAELERRRREVPELERRAGALREELARVLARIVELTGRAAAPSIPAARPARIPVAAREMAKSALPSKPRRRGGKPTVAENIQSVLRDAGAVRSLRDIVDATARLAGRDVNTSYGVQVSATMRRLVDAGVVRQAGRGQYQWSGAASRAADSGAAVSNGAVAGA